MPKFEISKSGIDAIKELINKGSDVRLRKRLKDLHYADIAEVIYELSIEQSGSFWHCNGDALPW